MCFNLSRVQSIHMQLSHWGRVTHICVGNLTIIALDDGLSPGWRQAIIETNAGILLIEPLGTNFSERLIGIQAFSFKKMHLKMSSAKWRPFCLGLIVLILSSKHRDHCNKPINCHKLKIWSYNFLPLSGFMFLRRVNTFTPRQNDRHFADDVFKLIFVSGNVWISIKIWLKFAPKGPIYNISVLVQIMAWRGSEDRPLSEPMIISLPTHIGVTRPQWYTSSLLPHYRVTLLCASIGSNMVCRLVGAKVLFKLIPDYY